MLGRKSNSGEFKQRIRALRLEHKAHTTSTYTSLTSGLITLPYAQQIAAEPSGAAAVAALMCDRLGDVRGKTVALTVSGGNVSIEELSRLLQQEIEYKQK